MYPIVPLRLRAPTDLDQRLAGADEVRDARPRGEHELAQFGVADIAAGNPHHVWWRSVVIQQREKVLIFREEDTDRVRARGV